MWLKIILKTLIFLFLITNAVSLFSCPNICNCKNSTVRCSEKLLKTIPVIPKETSSL